ncbi:hypothetical protein ACQPZP_32375 [Spirillospora sp. CA-142024]|uniref:hypothetical protein n=1 Tax=Spirillospora sp. CA-142024 TaxID=3240036 RepID=UPI003D8C5BE2
MAESPSRSGPASGDDGDAGQVIEDDAVSEAAGPEPFGGARPWWSVDSGGGTGPHVLVNGTGPQVLPAPRDGSGPQVMPGPVNGSGAHPIVGGTGPHGALPGGAGPLPTVPGGPPTPGKRAPRLLLVAGVAVVAAVVLMAGVLAFGTGGGALEDGRTTADSASKKVIDAGQEAGGLRKDGLTAPQASAAYPFIAGSIEAGGVPVAKHGLAVYTEEPVGKVNVLFMGGTGAIGKPADFLQKAQPTTFIAGQDADPGGKGGKAVCGTFAVLAETHTYCAWATKDSFGIVASNRATVNPQFELMADVMRRIRNGVERPK